MNPDKPRAVVRASIGETDTGGGACETTGAMAQAKQTIASTARETAARIKSAASDTTQRAKSEAQRLASETKQDAANRIGGYSSVIHESAKSLEQQDPNLAWATHRVADRIQSVADYIRNSQLDDLRLDAENLARRHPVAFSGGLFVAGLFIGNMLKAHRPETESNEERSGMDEAETGNDSGSSELAMGAPSAPDV